MIQCLYISTTIVYRWLKALTPTPSGVSVEKAGLGNALMMVITLQASGNLVNSYIDHNYGVDTVETAGDR